VINITIQYDSQLKRYSQCEQEDLEIPDQSNLSTALEQMLSNDKGDFTKRVFTEDGAVQPTLLVFLNDQVIRSDDITNCELNNGDIVSLYTPIAGG